MKQHNASARYALLDELRGLDLVSMMLYHGCWDLVNLFGIQANWYYGLPGHLWQQSICWVFILLSGFCVQLGHHTMRRGAQVFGAGALVTAVTLLFMPEDKVVFGVLTLLGSAMLLTGLLEKPLRRIPPAAGFAISAVLFALTRNVSAGYLGFGSLRLWLPQTLYANYVTAYFGFYPWWFYSTDYFALLPWLFLFWAGYFLYGVVKKSILLWELHIHYFFDRIMSDWRGRATASARSKQQKLQKNMLEGEPHEKVSCNARSGNDGTFPCSHPRACRRRSCIRS